MLVHVNIGLDEIDSVDKVGIIDIIYPIYFLYGKNNMDIVLLFKERNIVVAVLMTIKIN